MLNLKMTSVAKSKTGLVLNVIHNKLLRIMTFSKFNSNVCKLYKETQILNIDRIFKLEISTLIYKINFMLVPKQFIELLTKIEDIHSYHTRQRSSIEYAIHRTRLKIAQKSFTYAGIGIWSSIDPTIHLIPNYHLLLTKLKQTSRRAMISSLKNRKTLCMVTSKTLLINNFVL